jgi:hypothetical protein
MIMMLIIWRRARSDNLAQIPGGTKCGRVFTLMRLVTARAPAPEPGSL